MKPDTLKSAMARVLDGPEVRIHPDLWILSEACHQGMSYKRLRSIIYNEAAKTGKPDVIVFNMNLN